MHEIRFLTMSQENFLKYVSPTGILTDTEIVSTRQKLSGLDVAGLKWKENKRLPCSIVSFSRFDPANVRHDFFMLGDFDALNLVVNKAVLFHGVRLFGDTDGGESEVKFTIKNKNVTGTYRSEEDNDGVLGYDVMLPNPIPLLPNEENTIIATITGPNSCIGTRAKSSVKIDDIVVILKDSASGSFRTSSTFGQFYKIFLSEISDM